MFFVFVFVFVFGFGFYPGVFIGPGVGMTWTVMLIIWRF